MLNLNDLNAEINKARMPKNTLSNMRYIHTVGTQIQNMPTNNQNQITENWHLFPAGTNIADVKSWFKNTFNVTL